MNRPKRGSDISSDWVALLIFIVGTFVYLRPIFHNFSCWGIGDWMEEV